MLLALQRGSVDVVVANISTIVSRNLHEQLRYCYKLPVTAYCLAVFFLADFWRRLPEAVKSSFWEAGKWYDANQAPTINDKIYPEESWPLVRKAGVEIFDPPTSEREAFEAKAKPLWAAWKKRVGEENGQRGIDLCLGAP